MATLQQSSDALVSLADMLLTDLVWASTSDRIRIYISHTYPSIIAQQGTQVVIAHRDPDEVRPLKVTGDLGQIVPLEIDLKDRETINEVVRHSDIVYNLIGRDYETKYVC